MTNCSHELSGCLQQARKLSFKVILKKKKWVQCKIRGILRPVLANKIAQDDVISREI